MMPSLLLPSRSRSLLVKAARRHHRNVHHLRSSPQTVQTLDARYLWPLGLAIATVASLFSTADESNSCACEQPTKHGASSESSASKPKLRMCGEWCSSVDKSTPCRIDTSKIQCRGKHCATSAGLWSSFVLGPYSKHRPVSCEQYKAGMAYPVGACPCDPSCLIAEVKKARYPEPTGLGVYCMPGTCQPAASPRHAGGSDGLGTLECPCNWFGSECTDDWMKIRGIEKRRYGSLDQITLTIHNSHWGKLMKDYRPGAVARLNMRKGDSIHELACVVAQYSGTNRQLDLLLAPSDASLHPSVRHIPDLLRSYPEGPIPKDTPIYINPIISGFYNAHYQYMKEYITQHKVKTVIVVATGAGLGGAMSVLEDLEDQPTVVVRLYYGLRDVSCLPYSEQLSELVRSGNLDLILVESDRTNPAEKDEQAVDGSNESPLYSSSDSDEKLSPEVRAAVARGDAIKALLRLNRAKVYVQHAFEHHLKEHSLLGGSRSGNDSDSDSDSDTNSVVVVCGRLSVIDDTHAILERHGHRVGERLFLNI